VIARAVLNRPCAAGRSCDRTPIYGKRESKARTIGALRQQSGLETLKKMSP
jgi:hypothetical protein